MSMLHGDIKERHSKVRHIKHKSLKTQSYLLAENQENVQLPVLTGSRLPGSVYESGTALMVVVVRTLSLPIWWSGAWTGYHG